MPHHPNDPLGRGAARRATGQVQPRRHFLRASGSLGAAAGLGLISPWGLAAAADATPEAASAAAPPPEVAQALPEARPQGAADFRFFGLAVYRITLWTPQPLVPTGGWDQPLALALDYARRLDGTAIAERSIEEMRRVGEFGQAQAERWQARMSELFPDVQQGDRLTGLRTPAGGVRFYHQGRARGAVDEPRFGHLFFGIWLSPKTSAPALRERLLGLTR